jgi:hypothetical protein
MTTIHDDRHVDAAGDGAEKTVVEARQAVTTNRVRWMLAGGLVLGIALLSAAWLGYTAFQHPTEPATTTRPSTTAAQSTY